MNRKNNPRRHAKRKWSQGSENRTAIGTRRWTWSSLAGATCCPRQNVRRLSQTPSPSLLPHRWRPQEPVPLPAPLKQPSSPPARIYKNGWSFLRTSSAAQLTPRQARQALGLHGSPGRRNPPEGSRCAAK